jgi:hypothetical protein
MLQSISPLPPSDWIEGSGGEEGCSQGVIKERQGVWWEGLNKKK